ncbi:MAG TPA: patatin-like phospholipase family protein [Solirubrobacteraceae bacterium]|nr:patatin-like phospholipase family protein [Solirubrobacteraceae bacterium]
MPAPEPITLPDVLVLAGGGIIGEAWMTGVLAGIESAAGIDFRRCDAFVGTSAGSIVCAHLAAGRSPRRPAAGLPEDLAAPADLDETQQRAGQALLVGGARIALGAAGRLGQRALSPVAGAAVAAARPGGALTRAALLARLPRPSSDLSALHDRIARLGARFDGRLRVTAVDRRSGRRVVFGAPGAPRASVARAVEASCTVPWQFAPVMIGGREYVDGGVWSPTNLDVAPAGRDAQVLCLHPTAHFPATPGGALAAVRLFSKPAVAVEAAVLRRRGARVRVIGPNRDAGEAMGQDFMSAGRRADALEAGFRQGLTLAGERAAGRASATASA